ncbi:MAG TPA: fatty acid desaturase [Hyphomicrobiales bacterium]|nr:fatty acid desaturase [Hyphomicrobiales bacterium]
MMRYRSPSDGRAVLELALTLLPLAGLVVAMYFALQVSAWLALLLAVPTAVFLVRLFMIQHDCGHGSFFRTGALNDWIGRIAGVFTMTPYSYWKRTHATHHASSGCLEKRGQGDIDTLTVAEYQAKGVWGRLRYRLYRHPIVIFGVGPIYLFLLQHRLPVGLMREGLKPWLSVMGTNLGIAGVVTALVLFLGVETVLFIYLPVIAIAGAIGVWLFFIQHQFRGTVWAHEGEWNWHEAALNGSSFYDLPAGLRWLTANIGIHHVHHLASRIPFYRLNTVLKDFPQLRSYGRLTIKDSLSCVRLALWDETKHRMVTFREAAAAA